MFFRSLGFILFALALILVIQKSSLLNLVDSKTDSSATLLGKSSSRRSKTTRSIKVSSHTNEEKCDDEENSIQETAQNTRVADSYSETNEDHLDDLSIAEVRDASHELYKNKLNMLREEGIESLREAMRNPNSELRQLRRARN